MSFWDKVKGAGNAVAAAAVEAGKAAEKAVNDLRAAPTQVMCATCQTHVPVAPELWEWNCTNTACKKVNGPALLSCADCKTEKPKNLPNPKVKCQKCGTETVVPSSNAGRLFDDGKTVVVHGAAAAKREFAYMQEKPTQFNCQHCQTLLGVPAPMPWVCASAACKAQNTADAAKCTACGGGKPATANMVLCGVCNKPTEVPSNNFVVKLKHEFANAERGAKKLYLDIASKPYIMCPRCQNPLHVDLKKDKAKDGKADAKGADAKADAKANPSPVDTKQEVGAGAEGQPQPAAGQESVGGKAGAGQSSVVPPPQPEPEQNPGVEVVCNKCGERLLVAVGPAPAGGAAAVPAPAPAPAAAPAAVSPAAGSGAAAPSTTTA